MKFLFVHQNYPGQFLHITRHLVATRQHEVVFITNPTLTKFQASERFPMSAPDWIFPKPTSPRANLTTASGVPKRSSRTAQGLKHLGFTPDIIIGHHGWGEMLNLRDVWPDAPMLGYMEFYYQHNKADVGFDPEFPVESIGLSAHPGKERHQPHRPQSRPHRADPNRVAIVDLSRLGASRTSN